jgi:hypothetical protein
VEPVADWGGEEVAPGEAPQPLTLIARRLSAGRTMRPVFSILGWPGAAAPTTTQRTNGVATASVYYEQERGRRTAANLMTRDEAWRIAANIAKLPDLLRRPRTWGRWLAKEIEPRLPRTPGFYFRCARC